MIFENQISSFFRAPTEGKPNGTARSVLFVLRRDLISLYGAEDGPRVDEPPCPTLTAIGMFSGIDLLTWTVTGNVEDSLPGGRAYTKFLVDYGGLSQTDAGILYQFRCAQIHSYGLYTIDITTGSKKAGIKPTAYGFTITTGSQVRALIQPLAGRANHFVIGFWEFKTLFLRCFAELQRRLQDTSTPDHSTLINNFHQATEKIGFIDCT